MEKTNWTEYYNSKKSFFSKVTQKVTSNIILNVLKYKFEKRIDIMECGGGNSCFAERICNQREINSYDIVDFNELAVKLFNEKELNVANKTGMIADLLTDNLPNKKYDFVYSVGLIEHFVGNDVVKIIERHFEMCKPNGYVLITFPTPTIQYKIARRLMEIGGVWKFWDEKPILYKEVVDSFNRLGTVEEEFINRKIPLTQQVVLMKNDIY